ncbi:CBO0543 family protein [Fredinandcohnia sp. FSL W7-1320]|uniref:CBO0543 family protein n=1 Tax=Fredinandcohnia sp. FSL W7-1320 TaxID=2954540 RepID=UPI0030FD4F00
MNAIYGLIWLAALFIWGDWRNYRKYYPTYLFFLLGDFLYLYLLSDKFAMWTYTPQGVDEGIGLTNTHIVLSIMAIKYPATILIFLGRYPEERSWIKQFIYILLWVGIYAVNEAVDLFVGLIRHDHGWSLGWSVLFNLVMFSILRLHYVRPFRAWIASLIFILILWNIFDVPSSVFR